MEGTNQEIKIPSNIMVKSSYLQIKARQASYINDIINELYNYIYVRTEPHLREHLEIEAKLGRFNFVGEYVQCMQYIRETFQVPNYENRERNTRIDFQSGLDESQFYTIWYYVDKESTIPKSEIIRLEPINYKEIHYQSQKRYQVAYRGGVKVGEETIRKDDKLHINIRDNGNDFRLTACKEMNTEITDQDVETAKRDKFRVSYKFRFFRLDFTIATRTVDSTIVVTYEIELEFEDFPKISQNFQKYDDFKYILSRYIENVFCIYQTLSLDYYTEKTQNKQRSSREPLFGDYLERFNIA
jgi:hypothetical protein